MTTETAVTRVAAELAAVDGLPDLKVELTQADARALLQIIADMCEDHTRCSICRDTLCIECGIGEPDLACTDRHLFETHCTDCAGNCRTCSLEVAADRRAEAHAEATGGRY